MERGPQRFVDHPTPWRTEWTRFGESMGEDSRSRIVDANGDHVLTVGTGAQDQCSHAERLADRIVSAVNADPRARHLTPT